jgi:hypothetical protein
MEKKLEVKHLASDYPKQGYTAQTTCKVCGDKWLYGVENNTDFICPGCEGESDRTAADFADANPIAE